MSTGEAFKTVASPAMSPNRARRAHMARSWSRSMAAMWNLYQGRDGAAIPHFPNTFQGTRPKPSRACDLALQEQLLRATDSAGTHDRVHLQITPPRSTPAHFV